MKGLKTLAVVLVAMGLLASVASATPISKETPGSGASGPAFKHYVACGLSRKASPDHVCPKGSKKGAFFKSLAGNVTYTVCVKFPSGKNLCAKAQEAEKGTLYVNKVTSTIPGRHVVSWFVKGKKVGSFAFRISA
jgi:hypothetical protein